MAVRYPFPIQWQLKLLALMINNGATFVSEDLIKSEYFENPHHGTIASTVIKLYKKYGTALTYGAVKQAINKTVDKDEFNEIKRVFKKLKKPIKEIEEKLITDQVKRFARHQEIKSAIRSGIDLLEKDDLEALETKWMNALSVGKRSTAISSQFFFSSFDKRHKRRMKVPEVLGTLIPELDELLHDGGFHRGELNVFLALPGHGKSFALDHMAKAAVLQKKKVVFYTLEMSADKAAGRLDAAFSGVEIKNLRLKHKRISKKLEYYEKKFGDSLLIREFPAKSLSVGMLRSDLLSLKLQGFKPDVIIVDYINILGRSSNDDSYRNLGDVYIDLRGLAQEFNIWCITAGQSNRGGFKSELITMKDIGESFEGAMHADVIITLNRLQAEKKSKTLRLYLAKNRNEIDNITITIQTAFHRGLFYKRIA